MLAIATKTCTRCGRTYAATPAFFGRNKRRRDRLNFYCKHCDSARRVSSAEQNIKLPCYDLDKLYRDMKCETCDGITSHIYCQSEISEDMVYACEKCEQEVPDAVSVS
jgi:hypothetical protein